MKYILIIICAAFMFNAQAQNTEKKKEIEFAVNGNCGMCKDRIEKSLYIKGVKFSEWDSETKKIKVIYDPRKTDENTIHKAIADVGHDTELVKASDKDYENLHGCCKYDRSDLPQKDKK